MYSYYPLGSVSDPADDSHKPSLAFDGNPDTFIHPYGSAGVEIYFGGKYVVSKIIFQPRYNHYLQHSENTIFTIIKENGEEENCGTLTGTNTVSKNVADQTYEIPCDFKEGVGLKVWKKSSTNGWCPAEIMILYSHRECWNLILILILVMQIAIHHR